MNGYIYFHSVIAWYSGEHFYAPHFRFCVANKFRVKPSTDLAIDLVFFISILCIYITGAEVQFRKIVFTEPKLLFHGLHLHFICLFNIYAMHIPEFCF